MLSQELAKIHALQTKCDQLHQIYDFFPDCVLLFDHDGHIIDANKMALTHFQTDLAALKDQKHPDCFPDHVYLIIQDMIAKALSQQQTIQHDYWDIRSTKNRKFFSSQMVPLKNHQNKITQLLFINRDLTDQKSAQQDLQQKIDEMQSLQDQLLESEKMASLGSLVAGVAHEINTPVGSALTASTATRHFAENLVERTGNGSISKNEFYDFLKRIKDGCYLTEQNLVRTSKLISSFKQITADRTQDDSRIINLSQYIQEVIVTLEPQLKRHNTALSVDIRDDDINLLCFPGAIAQIITNLVMNALIHGVKDVTEPKIWLTIQRRDLTAIILVADNGKGMPQETISHIFEPFYTTKRGQGGTGLGLHITYNQIVGLMNGRINVTSVLNQGTEFRIEIPIVSEN